MNVAKLPWLSSYLKGAKKFARTLLNFRNKLWHSCLLQVYNLEARMACLRIPIVFPNRLLHLPSEAHTSVTGTVRLLTHHNFIFQNNK